MSSNRKEIILKRLQRLEKLKCSKELQAIALQVYKKDIVTFTNDLVWTYDPRVKESPMLPFILFDFQVDFIRWMEERYEKQEHGVILKSRDLGASWSVVLFLTHRWLFEDGFRGTLISKKQDAVEAIGNPDSLFEKIRIILKYLPSFVLPKEFNWDKHDNYAKLINPSNGAVLSGEFGETAGRSGRSSIALLDEFAFIDRAEKVEAAISQNSNCVLFLSTPNGTGNAFFRKSTNGNVPVFRMHWKQDPRKNYWEVKDENGKVVKSGKGETFEKNATYPWYEKQKRLLDPVIIETELDLRFDSDLDGVFIPGNIIQTAIDLKLPPTGQYKISPYHPYVNKQAIIPRVKIAGLDVATTGKNQSVLCCREGSTVLWFKAFKNLDPTQLAFKVLELWEELSEEEQWQKLICDADGVGAGTISTLAAIPNLPFEIISFRGGSKASNFYNDATEKYNYETYANSRAEAWGMVRERLKNTFDHVNGVKEHDPENMISIPNEAILITQLSAPKYKYTTDRKILLESKEDMAKRGVLSPDWGDALAYAYANIESADTGWLGKL